MTDLEKKAAEKAKEIADLAAGDVGIDGTMCNPIDVYAQIASTLVEFAREAANGTWVHIEAVNAHVVRAVASALEEATEKLTRDMIIAEQRGRMEALEEAAKVAEDPSIGGDARYHQIVRGVACRIRALAKEELK